MEKTNVTLRVRKDLVDRLRKKKVNLSDFFNDAAEMLIFKKSAFIDIRNNDLEFVKIENGHKE